MDTTPLRPRPSSMHRPTSMHRFRQLRARAMVVVSTLGAIGMVAFICRTAHALG